MVINRMNGSRKSVTMQFVMRTVFPFNGHSCARALACLAAVLTQVPAIAADASKPKKKAAPAATPSWDTVGTRDVPKNRWGDWVEKDFPFFSSVVDARDVGEGFPKDNLTPRGLILNLGHNLWACFDIDLLRIACIWEGEEGKPPVTPVALAPGSYHVAGQKTKDGQDDLPKPIGKVWLANGIYPGWQVLKSADDQPSFTDPREPGPSKEEVGKGSLGTRHGVLRAVVTDPSGVVLELDVNGVAVRQRFEVRHDGKDRSRHVHCECEIAPHEQPICWIMGTAAASCHVWREPAGAGGGSLSSDPLARRIFSPAKTKERYGFTVSREGDRRPLSPAKSRSGVLWPQIAGGRAALSQKNDPYVLDDIPLPLDNPWKRNVRLADIDFLDDQGNAVGVTMDGDVWLIGGLRGDLEKVTWKRFASGLHEPMSIVVRKAAGGRESATDNKQKERGASDRSTFIAHPSSDMLVFDRDGVWNLRDTNGDHEADRYEMFCNLFAQTAETREFPNSMKLGPKGELYLSKGGQEGTTRGKHNGTVIRVAADGKSFEVIGYGLRQPFIGVHPKTGLVTASDQQGNYVPSTPLHIIEHHHFYGHLPTIAPKEQYPETIAEPLTWIPHPVNPSGVTQVWLTDAKMGPLNDELIHIGYNRPELFRVLVSRRFSRPQATVMSFWRDFDFGPLNAKVNPADGQLYVVGFQIWGTVAKKISGLARIRYTNAPRVLLKECTPTDQGVLLSFTHSLDPKLATDPASYSAERWNYKRTADYGSPHLKLDGTPGQEWMIPSSAYLSKDGKSVFVGIPGMKAGVHQMRIGWGLKSVDGLKAENTAYFSPWELAKFDAAKEGFGDITVDLTPRAAAAVAAVKPTLEEGQRLYQMIGCMACHSTDGSTIGKVGPSWKGLFGSERILAKGGEQARADEVYLRESITNPSAKVVKGFEKFDTGMPIYAGILNESQIESLILYIKSLK